MTAQAIHAIEQVLLVNDDICKLYEKRGVTRQDLREVLRMAQLADEVRLAAKGVSLCARCHGDGFTLYFESDGSGAEKYECRCLELRKALQKLEAL